MEFQQVIEERRSIRKFTNQEVSHDQIQAILESARLAPSGTNQQPWRFVVVTSQEGREQLRQCSYNLKFISQAPVVFVCCADMNSYKTAGRKAKELAATGAFKETGIEDLTPQDYKETMPGDDEARKGYIRLNTAIAIEHMALKATDLGLGSCWVMLFKEDKVKELLGLDENMQVVALLPVGYPAEEPISRPRVGMDEIVLKTV